LLNNPHLTIDLQLKHKKRISKKIFAKKQAIPYLINLSFQYKNHPNLLQQILVQPLKKQLIFV
jgi:hypothetical protein